MAGSVKRPFWLHQFAEYVIGAALVGSGLQSPNPEFPSVLGGLVILNAAAVDGPLGAFRLVGRSVHRILDIVVVVLGLAATALARLDIGTRITQLCCLIVLGMVVMNTNYSSATPRKRVLSEEADSNVRDRPEEIGRRAGRVAGTLASRARSKWRA